MKRKRFTGFIIKLLTTFFLFYLLVRLIKFDLREFKTILLSINLYWLILSFTGVIIVLALKSYRWHLLLKQSDILYSPVDSLRSYFSSYAVGIVTPGRLGEFIKTYNVRQKTGSGLIASFQSTLTDRLFDLIMLLIFAISWVILNLSGIGINQLTATLISLILVVSVILLLRIIMQKLNVFKSVRFEKLKHFINKCLLDMTCKKSFFPWMITVSAYFFFFLTTWFLFRSLGIYITIIDSGFIISIIGLVLLLPISIAGFGTRELSLVYILSIYGISAESSITFSLLHFIVFFVWGGIIGLIFWIINPTPLEAIKADSKRLFRILKGNTE